MCLSIVFCIIVCIVHVEITVTFNLDPRIPVIKYGKPGSYFGYSVAEHRIIGQNKNLLLVGAPLGQNFQPQTNQSGSLWRCNINMDPEDCSQIITDGRRDDEDRPLYPPTADETKNGQWMGSVVHSQGRSVLVCAHRYMKNYWGNGLCYILSNDLNREREYLEPCQGFSKTRAHEEYGYCQVGTSGIFLQDDTVIIGAPGPYTWRGTIFVADMQENDFDRDMNIYQSPLNNENQPVDKYSYLGMSVASGNFFENKTSYAAGSPRANNTGQVLIFSKTKKKKFLDHDLTLSGEQFGSSFGYEMTSTDINNDNLTDLIVGAPFYFQKHEGGAVYVFLNSKKKCNFNCAEPLKLTGKPESRFGLSIANLGDLNKDGFNDIAIGAPYEGNGVVYIYLGSKDGLITIPSQRIAAEDLPDKSIKTFGYSLSGGVDMDNNEYPDLLVGAYENDRVVLLRARPIIDIKTKIKNMSNMRNIEANLKGCERNRTSENTCFSFDACCKIMSLGKSTLPKHLQLNYQIEAETFTGNNRKFSRVWIGNNITQYIFKSKINIMETNKEYCVSHIIYIKPNTKDILSPIKFRLNYTLEQNKPKFNFYTSLPVIDNYPILNKQEAEKIFNATFQKDCGTDEICESDINVNAKLLIDNINGVYDLILGLEEELKLIVNVSNLHEPAYEAQLFVEHPPGLSYIASITDKQVLCNRNNDTLVVCTLGNPFKKGNDANILLRFNPKTLDGKMFKLRLFANSTSKEITQKYPRELSVNIVKKANISITGLPVRKTVIYGGEVKGESAVKYVEDIGSNVVHNYYITNFGPYSIIPRLTVEVSWPYQVANNKVQGKWLLYLEKIPVIDAPNGGECFLAPGQVNPLNLTTKPDPVDYNLEKKVDVTKEDQSPIHNRVRRDTEVVIRSRTIVDKNGHKREVVTMDCEKNTAKCIKFNCSIYNLPRQKLATLTIKSRLWNSTLVEDYPQVDWVEIISQAKIYIPNQFEIEQITSDNITTVETYAYPDLINQQVSEPISLWIIIVAIVAGLLVLILLTLLLWKFGFFKRRRPNQMITGNLEKHHEESPFLGRQDQ